ncbi:UNVERIFIED_CONTAM: hypothetical protein RKD50_000117 [Streptomyces canus]
MIRELALQRGLQHPLRQLLQQAALTGEFHATGLGPGNQLGDQPVIHGIRRTHSGLPGLGVTRHVSHQLSLPARELHRVRNLYSDLTRIAAGLTGDAERLTPADVFARMEPLLETFSDLEDLCPRPKAFPVGIRRPKPPTGPDNVAGPVPDPWFVAGPLPDPWFVDLTPVHALPVLEALDTLAEAFTDGQASQQFGEVLANARNGIA